MGKANYLDDVIIKACFGEYFFVFYRNLEKNQFEVKILPEKGLKIWDEVFSKRKDYLLSIQEIIESKVHPSDKDKVLRAYDTDYCVNELKDKKSYSVYYRRMSEDGFRYEKLTVSKAEGINEPAVNVVFCCSDFDEEMRENIRKEEEKRRYFSVVYALGREYNSLYYVNLDNGDLTTYNISNRIEGLFGNEFYEVNYDEASKSYLKKAVAPKDMKLMEDTFKRENILKRLKEKDHFTQIYLNNDNNYCEMKCVLVEEGESNIAVMGFAVKDAEIRLDMETKENMEFQLALLDGLSREYETVWLIGKDRQVHLFRVGEVGEAQNAAIGYYETGDFDTGIDRYIDSYVAEEDKERLKRILKYDSLTKRVPDSGIYPVTFKRVNKEKESVYLQMCFTWADTPSGEKCMAIGLRNVDVIIREENRKKELFQNAIKEREIDVLTGLRNRYCYENAFTKIDRKDFEWISCVYIDVDGLHELNNYMGHDAGDELIKQVAGIIVSTWGNINSYRTGGDEFIIFLFDKDTVKLVDEINSMKEIIEKEGNSISVGYSQEAKCRLEIHNLIKDAEKMMYAEKITHHRERGISRD